MRGPAWRCSWRPGSAAGGAAFGGPGALPGSELRAHAWGGAGRRAGRHGIGVCTCSIAPAAGGSNGAERPLRGRGMPVGRVGPRGQADADGRAADGGGGRVGGMMGPLRASVVAGVLVIVSAGGSFASPASPANSTVPDHITLVCSRAGQPDIVGSFTVMLRDFTNNPMFNRDVDVDLSGCTDLEICSDQLDPAASVDCAAKRIRKFTGATGSVSFTVLGHSNGLGDATTLQNGVKIFGTGVLLRSLTASAFDLDGSNGVGINDLAVWLNDFGTSGNPPYGRSDFDGDGKVDVDDLSGWAGGRGRGRGGGGGCGVVWRGGGGAAAPGEARGAAAAPARVAPPPPPPPPPPHTDRSS